MSLAQSSLALRQSILAKQSQGDAAAISASFVSRVGLNTDLHKAEILLTMFDSRDIPVSFALPLEVAKPLAEHLPSRVAEIEAALPNKTFQ